MKIAEIYQINSEAAKYFKANLNGRSRDYLTERGISRQSIDEWGIGCAPDSWDALLNHLANLGYSHREIESAGLIKARKSSGYYDRFRDRLMIPIRDADGRVVGFAGRAFGDAKPKYLNSPETEIFKKGELLYGLDRAKDAIANEDQAIVAEGYMDIIALHSQGIKNAVASMGTALKASQIKQLIPLTKNLTLALDNDQAGQKATERAIATISSEFYDEGMNVRVLSLPDGVKDSDEFLQSHSSEQYRELLQSARVAKIEKPAPKLPWKPRPVVSQHSTDRDRAFTEIPQKLNEDLGELIESKGIALKKQGKELVGLCPFHNDTHPSLSVNPTKGVYVCRSCGASGNGIKFLMDIDKVSFKEAIEANARHYGYDLDDPLTVEQKQLLDEYKKANPEAVRQHQELEAKARKEALLERALKIFKPKKRNRKPAPYALGNEAGQIIYEDELQTAIANEAKYGTAKTILIDADTGAGKTTAIADLTPENCGSEALWYITPNARNVTVEAIARNYRLLPSRYKHGEIVIDENGLARRKKGPGDTRPIHGGYDGNCQHSELFRAFQAKGHDMDWKGNPICGACSHAKACGSVGIINASYKADRRQAYTAKRIRAHMDSLSSPTQNKNPYEQAIALMDDNEINPLKTYELNLKELEATTAKLALDHPYLLEPLRPLLAELKDLLESPPDNRYGDNDKEARRSLQGLIPDIIWSTLDDFKNSLDIQIEQALAVDSASTRGLTPEQKNVVKAANRELQREALEAIERLSGNWLIPLLNALSPQEEALMMAESEGTNITTSLRLNHGKLTITEYDPRPAQLLKAFKKVFIFNATETRLKLAAKLGLKQSDIKVIKVVKRGNETPYSNLTARVLTDFPSMNKQASPEALGRAAAAIASASGKVAVLTHKALRDDLEKRVREINPTIDLKIGAFYVESRGQNHWQDREHLFIVGCPTPNLGALADEFKIYFGYCPQEGDDEFMKWVAQYQQAELKQAIGRLRANRRDEKLMVTFVGNAALCPDDFLLSACPGAIINHEEGWQLAKEAGTRFSRNLATLTEALVINGDRVAELTQNKLAAIAGISKGQASKILSKIEGGFGTLIRCFQSLYRPLIGFGNTSDIEIKEDAKLLQDMVLALLQDLQNFLTDDEYTITRLDELRTCYGEAAYKIALATLPEWAKAQYSALIMRLVPELEPKLQAIAYQIE